MNDINLNKMDLLEKIELLEIIMDGYEAKANLSINDTTTEFYFLGVVDGLNHAWKILNNTEDDYLGVLNKNKRK